MIQVEFVVDQSPVGMVFVITVYVDNESLCGRLMNKCLEFFSNTRSLRANSSSGVSSNQCKSSLSVSVPMIRLSAFAVVIGATAANNRNNRKEYGVS